MPSGTGVRIGTVRPAKRRISTCQLARSVRVGGQDECVTTRVSGNKAKHVSAFDETIRG